MIFEEVFSCKTTIKSVIPKALKFHRIVYDWVNKLQTGRIKSVGAFAEWFSIKIPLLNLSVYICQNSIFNIQSTPPLPIPNN